MERRLRGTRGNVLEIDEREDLLTAAEEVDQKVTPKVLERAAAARALRDQGPYGKAADKGQHQRSRAPAGDPPRQ